MLLWHCGLWKGLSLASGVVSQVIVDVGAHHWSRFLPELRRDPKAWLVLVEPGRGAFLELYRRLKVDYQDLLERVVALPVALTWEEGAVFLGAEMWLAGGWMVPGMKWGFRALHTNDFLGGECRLAETYDSISLAYTQGKGMKQAHPKGFKRFWDGYSKPKGPKVFCSSWGICWDVFGPQMGSALRQPFFSGNSLLVPDENFDHPCTAKGPEILVPATWP